MAIPVFLPFFIPQLKLPTLCQSIWMDFTRHIKIYGVEAAAPTAVRQFVLANTPYNLQPEPPN